MRTDLIVSTYENPRALALTLTAVALQTRAPDAVIVADDGSGTATTEVIARFAAAHPGLAVLHEWHPDRGFEKNAILNKAVARSEAEFLVFIDGDCLIHPGFVARHLAVARRDRFASGSLLRLGPGATAAVREADVVTARVFDRRWLAQSGALGRWTARLKAGEGTARLRAALEHVYPVARNWCGANASAFRDAILAVNGLDEEMRYGGGDKEFGIRLANSGVQGRHLRFTAPVVHLDHPRAYRRAEEVRAHRRLIAEARRTGKTWAARGIVPAADGV